MPATSDHESHPCKRVPARVSKFLATVLLALGWMGPLPSKAEDTSGAIGVVRLNLPAGLSIVSIPFTAGDNHLNTLLPLTDSAIGATVSRFDAATGGYGQPIQFVGEETGWLSFDTNASWLVVLPGEAFFLWLREPAVISLVGEVPQGRQSTTIPGFTSLSLKASPVPQSGQIGHRADGTGNSSGLVFPALSQDQLFLFDSATQTFKEAYTYLEGPGWSSSNPDDPGPDGPVLGLGSGFWLYRTMAPEDWVRTFDVNSPSNP